MDIRIRATLNEYERSRIENETYEAQQKFFKSRIADIKAATAYALALFRKFGMDYFQRRHLSIPKGEWNLFDCMLYTKYLETRMDNEPLEHKHYTDPDAAYFVQAQDVHTVCIYLLGLTGACSSIHSRMLFIAPHSGECEGSSKLLHTLLAPDYDVNVIGNTYTYELHPIIRRLKEFVDTYTERGLTELVMGVKPHHCKNDYTKGEDGHFRWTWGRSERRLRAMMQEEPLETTNKEEEYPWMIENTYRSVKWNRLNYGDDRLDKEGTSYPPTFVGKRGCEDPSGLIINKWRGCGVLERMTGDLPRALYTITLEEIRLQPMYRPVDT